MKRKLVLASTSPFRRELLLKLGIPFQTFAPQVDEIAFPGELAYATAHRLAIEKARSLVPNFPDALIIGSDQVAELASQHIGKPLTHEKAVQQLKFMRGQSVVFHTALALLNSKTGHVQSTVVPTTVSFRNLSDTEIESYLHREQPYNCAGSAKSEGLGIALIANMEMTDPNALIGLPMIELVSMLKNEGVEIF